MSTPQNLHNLAPANTAKQTWVLFCAVVDNFGDMGVCWRLARQLVSEHNLEVALFVDDFSAMAQFLALGTGDSVDSLEFEGVSIIHWQDSDSSDAQLRHWVSGAAVLIEAFACHLPETAQLLMAEQADPPVWLNLEYLSAESWPDDCHGLPSMISIGLPNGQSVQRSKYFFFPGYSAATGGLLREKGVVAQHCRWQSRIELSRRQFLSDMGGVQASSAELWLSVFSYPAPSLLGVLQAMAEQEQATHCFIPLGRALQGLEGLLGSAAIAQPGSHSIGRLTVHIIPFLSQSDYDRLLSVCDFNIVRGEDSFVRAQWAGRPFLWHIYPQEEGVHMDKLEAFLERMGEGLAETGDRELYALLANMWRKWNLDEDCADLWHHLRPQLPQLQDLAVQWRTTLLQLPDLSTNLLQFCREHESASI
ncbi:MAG: elongation factor P maturation arginine rhamnosyltransferase EarP [Pseudohongiellaceae bacterium]|nr:elongation factor P maturation arginine rhamnosyltransferase EarP [Pseudohongiellaceae bacterium]